MENNFWDKRYAEPDYVYGTVPNEYFKKEIDCLESGMLLLPGEGEGRNAVYAAKNRWEVTAIDFSAQGKKKAMRLAKNKKVEIEYIVSPIENFKYAENKYDAIALIFVHFNPEMREKVHKLMIKTLKKGGTLIIEAFSKSQINNNSGGPKDISSLYSLTDLIIDFSGLRIDIMSEQQIQLTEGVYHKGTADVLRFKATK